MAAKKTTSRKKTTARKTTQRKTAARKQAESRFETFQAEAKENLTDAYGKARSRVAKLNQTVLERQHGMFERTWDAMTKLQERSEERINGWIGDSELVPAQAKDMAKVWSDARRSTRRTYKKSVDKSYELAIEWNKRAARA